MAVAQELKKGSCSECVGGVQVFYPPVSRQVTSTLLNPTNPLALRPRAQPRVLEPP